MAAPALALSGNEITDAARAAAPAWATTKQGGSTDGATIPAGFGIWEAGTNLFRRGQCDAATDWLQSGPGTVTRTPDATTPAPFSPQSLKVVTDGTGVGQGSIPTSATGQAATAGTLGVGSIWFKGVSGASYSTRLEWNNTDATNTPGASTVFNATGSWQLVTLGSVAVAVGKTGDTLVLRFAVNGTRAETFWLAHPMLQKGVNVVSPYVATSGGATATRPAARVQAPLSLLNATQGWAAIKVKTGWAAAQVAGTNMYVFTLNDGTANNRIECFYDTNGHWTTRKVQGGTAGSTPTVLATIAAGDVATVVLAWTATTLALSVNGAAFTTLANTNVPTGLTGIDICRAAGASNWFDGSVLWFACGTGTLANADAAFLGGLGRQPTGLAELPGTATGYWKAVDSTYEARSPSSAFLLCGPLFICGTQTVMPQFQQDAICGTPTCGFATCGMFWAATYAGGEHLLAQVPDAVTTAQIVPAAGLTLGGVAPIIDLTESLATPSAGLTLSGVVPALRLSQTVPVPAGELDLGGVAPGFVGQLWLHDEVCTDLTLVAAGSQDLVLVGAGVTTLDLDPEECR